MKLIQKCKDMLKMNKKGAGEGLFQLILTAVAIIVFGIVILALWNPTAELGIRFIAWSFINDPNFTETYGTSISGALTYALDVVPMAIFFGIIGTVLVVFVVAIKGGRLGMGGKNSTF